MEAAPQLKIKANLDHVVELMYDSPKEGESDYGIWHRYTLMHDNREVCLFASDALDAKLKHFATGDRVNIRKEEYEPGKYGWNIIPQEGTSVRRTSSPDGAQKTATPSAAETEDGKWDTINRKKRCEIAHGQSYNIASTAVNGANPDLYHTDIKEWVRQIRECANAIYPELTKEPQPCGNILEPQELPPIDDEDLPF